VIPCTAAGSVFNYMYKGTWVLQQTFKSNNGQLIGYSTVLSISQSDGIQLLVAGAPNPGSSP
jgi:hypothetical protein